MANISISNLEPNDAESLLVALETGESGLVKAAVERAIDARKVAGGMARPDIYIPNGDPFCRIPPWTVGIIIRRPSDDLTS